MESFPSNVVFFVTTLVVAMNIFLVHSSFSSNDTSRSSDVVKASMQDQVDALLAWKRSLTLYDDTPLNSWRTDSTVCEWEGIACDDMGRLVRIDLHSTSLKGNLENFNFFTFPDLVGLDLGDNYLGGSIPPQISNLTKLTILDLSKNLLTGSIPTTIGNMLNLSQLHLSSNQLVGSLPQSIGQLKSLFSLDLSSNQLVGSLPQSIGQLKSLFSLHILINKLIGPIPATIGNMTELEYLDLSSNQLVGSLPQSIGQLKSLVSLNLSSNQLVGSLPQSIGQLKSLLSLHISINKLIGPIPATIGNMTKLEYLDLSSNQLVGSLPQSIGQLKSLVSIHLSTNKLTGPIPTAIGDMSSLSSLSLRENQINGSIPEELWKLTQLEELDLSSNHLSGDLPNSYCYVAQRKRSNKEESLRFVALLWNYDGQIAYEDIIKEIEDFDIKYCVGVGGYGSIYRALLQSDRFVTLKKFHNWEQAKGDHLPCIDSPFYTRKELAIKGQPKKKCKNLKMKKSKSKKPKGCSAVSGLVGDDAQRVTGAPMVPEHTPLALSVVGNSGIRVRIRGSVVIRGLRCQIIVSKLTKSAAVDTKNVP
ncbi:hypothetical protein Sjap_015741 [Stephania japonica]|uniref:Leucine-rich repeat-containing N-terminal plant-type domain-containing protein n=1 Tax=Stephania japonica TaxID=461633 RepID=A0AAP0IJS0_9MAGN